MNLDSDSGTLASKLWSWPFCYSINNSNSDDNINNNTVNLSYYMSDTLLSVGHVMQMLLLAPFYRWGSGDMASKWQNEVLTHVV